MDLESYMANYTGSTRVKRLVFIARHSEELREEALEKAIGEMREGCNIKKFREVWKEFKGDTAMDEATAEWGKQTETTTAIRLSKLEKELGQYKVNLVKESIRLGYHEIGQLQQDSGDVVEAIKSFMRTRDYCTNPNHVLDTCISVILAGVELENYTFVSNYSSKAEATPNLEDKATLAMIRAAQGLCFLNASKYRQAALRFVQCTVSLADKYSNLASCGDIATYGTLCALASFDRSELKSKVIDNVKFRDLLEVVPEVRELVYGFFESRYERSLAALAALKAQLELDIHLQPHVSRIYTEIRNKALMQYLVPYSTAQLDTMAATFACQVDLLEKELSTLIMEDKIKARIDSKNKVLTGNAPNAREATYQRVLNLTQRYEKDTITMMLRANCMRHQYRVGRSGYVDVKGSPSIPPRSSAFV